MIERDIYVLNDVVKTPIDYVRGTNTIPIIFHFRDYDIPSGSTAEAFVFNRDGTGTQIDADVSGNDVEIQPVTDLFSEMGEAMLQVKISKSSNVLVTFAYPVAVRPNYTEGDAQPGGNHSGFFGELQDAADAANKAATAANDAAENAESKAQAADEAAEAAKQASQQIQQNAAAGNYSASVNAGNVTTGAPGTQAAVTNSGTAKDAVFDFVIPQGPTGPQGPRGPQGPQGPTGTIENLPTATVEFEEAAERENIKSGETVAVLFGKIQKWLSDLGTWYPRLNRIQQVDISDVFTNIPTVSGIAIAGKLTIFEFGLNVSPYTVKLVCAEISVTAQNKVIPENTALGQVKSEYSGLFGSSGTAVVPPIDCKYVDGYGTSEIGARIGVYPYSSGFSVVMYNVDSSASGQKKYIGSATWIAAF